VAIVHRFPDGAGRVCSRGSGNAFRSRETWICTIFCAESGTSSPQSQPISCFARRRAARVEEQARKERALLPDAICTGT
jgi:hypothetical protein